MHFAIGVGTNVGSMNNYVCQVYTLYTYIVQHKLGSFGTLKFATLTLALHMLT